MRPIKVVNLKAYLVGGVAVLFLTMCTFAFILLHNLSYISQNVEDITKIIQITSNIQELREETKTAESYVKDSFVRNNENYLQPYYDAYSNFPKLIDILNDNFKDDVKQEAVMQELGPLINKRFLRYDEGLKIFRMYGLEGLRAWHPASTGAQMTEQIDIRFKKLLDTENLYVDGKKAAFDHAEKVIVEFLLVLLLVILITFILCSFTVSIIIKREQREKYLLITNQELEVKVRERTKELQEANSEMESFSYSVSHDLRAPLRAIEGFSNLIIEDFREMLGSEGMRKMDIIISSVRRMSQLIDDILNFSRIGRKEFVKTKTNLNKLAELSLEEVQKAYLGSNKCKVTIEELGSAFVDATSFRQVFVNLISNAIKFSAKSNNPEVTIGISSTDPIIYFVKDNGIGFDMKYYNKLFGVFQRLHSIDEFEGTGVGLAIVKKVLDKHNGKIRAESEPEKGAVFFFCVPDENESVCTLA